MYHNLMRSIMISLFLCSTVVHAQNMKNEEEMMNKFKKFILTKDDFGESLEKINGHFSFSVPPTYEFIGKPDISTEDYKNHYALELTLKDKTLISTDYTILDTPEDVMKAAIYISSDTAWTAHVLPAHAKKELGLEQYAAAFYYDEHYAYALRCQFKNILFDVSVHPGNEKKDEKTIQMVLRLAKTIIERIKKDANEK